MSRTTNRDAAEQHQDSVEQRLARWLDSPFPARVVPHLPPETLQQLIRHQGLDACADLVTAATPAQLTSVLDLDLWCHAQPGRDGRFDAERFAEWIEVLVDTGDSVAARTVAALDQNLVVAGLSRYLRVFDPGIFEPTAQSDDEAIELNEAMREGDTVGADAAIAGDRLSCEVGGYIVRARRGDAWDAMVALLFALEHEHPDCFHAVMQGCRRLSNSRPEVDGLDDLLLAPEQHLHDVALERERRQSQQGYATPADARAFLQLARHAKPPASTEVNPILAAYLRAADDASPSTSTTVDVDPSVVSESIAVTRLLREAGVIAESPRALLAASDADASAPRLMHLRQWMERMSGTGPAADDWCSRELAFLANTLVAGCAVQSRPFTPQEASVGVASICNLGLEYWPARRSGAPTPTSLVAAFEVGWSVLHQDVGMFVARELIVTLDQLHCVDRDLRRELVALRRKVAKAHDDGTPWLARDAAEALAALDITACTAVVGLLEECPVLPAALTAIIDGRTTTVSPTAFDFISTAAQIGDVRTFMQKLAVVLA